MYYYKKIFISIFLVSLAVDCLGGNATSTEESNEQCSPSKNHERKWRGYTNKGEKDAYYKIHTARKSWLDAKAQCESEEALLFYPDDQAEVEMIAAWWGEVTSDYMAPREYPFIHIGVTDLNSTHNGTYATVDGIPIDEVYHRWFDGEPNNSDGIEHCGQLHYNLQLNDVKCDGKEFEYQNDWFYLPYICKKKLKVEKIKMNYQHSNETGNCYSLQLYPLNWNDAEATCAADHAHLAIINSQEEADFLVQMVAEAPTDQVTGDFLRDIVHLGFYSRHIDYWETVTGQYLSQAGYDKWGFQQPENCGSMYLNGTLKDISCDAVAFYICERETDNITVKV